MSKRYDLIVCGGGFAGTAAAVAAAREGASVLLVEKGNALGGAAGNSLVHPFMGYSTHIGGKTTALCQGLFGEICRRLPNGGSPLHDETLKLVLNRLVLEAGVEPVFHAQMTAVQQRGKRIESVTVCGYGRSFELSADSFIDATGDANLIAMTDFPDRVGREQDGLCQPMTLCFRVVNVDMEQFSKDWKPLEKLYAQYKEEGKIKNPREDVLIFKTCMNGVLHFNTTRVVRHDPTDLFSVTRAEIEAREQVFEVFNFLKSNFKSFENSEIISTAPEIGIRESRMIDGEYLLTGADLVACRKFDDAVAAGNYDIDIHNPEGSGTSHYYFPDGQYYTIPYRSLIPKDAENLLVAGRCISADHEAQASIRIMPIVCCLGEAAGTAAGLAVKHGWNVGDVDVLELRQVLLQNGAFLG